jgi:hypothetical protein
MIVCQHNFRIWYQLVHFFSTVCDTFLCTGPFVRELHHGQWFKKPELELKTILYKLFVLFSFERKFPFNHI